ADGAPAYQLERLHHTARIIRSAVTRRLAGVRHELDVGWREELDARLKNPVPGDEEREELARTEKAAALAELSAARFSVLIGPAGTGKTTLLQTLGNHPTVEAGGVLLLAPTGKARVRLQTTTGLEAQTVAQFLSRRDRYDGETGAYLITGDNQ